MPPQSAAALAGVLLSKSLVPAPFLECVPSLKLILVSQPTSKATLQFLSDHPPQGQSAVPRSANADLGIVVDRFR
jgi:hypothetical protein